MNKFYETERLQLRILNMDYAPLVLLFYAENKSQFEPWEPTRSDNFYSLSYQKASLTAELNQIAEGKLIRYWIFLKGDPERIIGTICFQNLMKEPYRSCCLGYKFHHEYHHQGYARESIQCCIDLLFQEYYMHRMEAYIMPTNQASIRLIEQLGFLPEGISRSYARVNGSWEDHLRYALINPLD